MQEGERVTSEAEDMDGNYGKESVRAYLTLIQDVISRMATNSASCKTWCVTLISALLVMVIDKGKPNAILLGLIPLALFCFLDAYYLSLEHDFRSIYRSFVGKLHDGTATGKDLYDLTPENDHFGQRMGALFKQVFSFSILPFYGIILVILLVVYFVVPPATPVVTATGVPNSGAPAETR